MQARDKSKEAPKAKILFETKDMIYELGTRIIRDGDKIYFEMEQDCGPDGFHWERSDLDFEATEDGFAQALELLADHVACLAKDRVFEGLQLTSEKEAN